MTAETHRRGLLDTNVMILRRWIPPSLLPAEVAISAITLAELSAGPHQVRRGAGYVEHTERARRVDILQRVESEFDPIPFDAAAARVFGRVTAAVLAIGRTPRRRIADLMIASVAAANELPLYTTNPDDFAGLHELLSVVALPVPQT